MMTARKLMRANYVVLKELRSFGQTCLPNHPLRFLHLEDVIDRLAKSSESHVTVGANGKYSSSKNDFYKIAVNMGVYLKNEKIGC